jgi:hypothetical protein
MAEASIVEETPAYSRVVFDYPPFNIVDDTVYQGLQDLLALMDASPASVSSCSRARVPKFFLAHFDLTAKAGNITTAVGPTISSTPSTRFKRR